MWQREPFRLEIIPPSEVAPGHLRGKTEFGDNIDDEWFIVYMLRMLTSHIEGASASVEDNDGEFLLIEAAEQIPAWLSPENAENRVFFHGGKLHLVPHPTSPSDFGLLPVGSASVYGNMYMYIHIYITTLGGREPLTAVLCVYYYHGMRGKEGFLYTCIHIYWSECRTCIPTHLL